MNRNRIEILQALVSGRTIVRKGYGFAWEDKVSSPSLKDADVSALFRAALIESEVVNKLQRAIAHNLTGRVVLTDWGRTMLGVALKSGDAP